MPEIRPFAENRRRTKAIDAGIARIVVITAVIAATNRLILRAPMISTLPMNVSYQRSVKPSHGNETSSRSLKEKISRITSGAYRKARATRT